MNRHPATRSGPHPGLHADAVTGTFTGLVATGLRATSRGRVLVDDVALELAPGEVVGLLGPNGAGKTTTFRMLAGIRPARGGRIELAGRPITSLPLHRRARLGLGYLPQESSIFRDLSVAANLEVALELAGVPARQRRERIEALLIEFHLHALAAQPARTLSGGERRRLEIARAVAAEPRFLLLDEPFAGVDPIAVYDLQRLVTSLANRGLGILITDHNVRATLSSVQRAYILAQGRVIAAGTPETLASDEQVRRIYLGADFAL